jgi:hypothetical protein
MKKRVETKDQKPGHAADDRYFTGAGGVRQDLPMWGTRAAKKGGPKTALFDFRPA